MWSLMITIFYAMQIFSQLKALVSILEAQAYLLVSLVIILTTYKLKF